MIKTEVIALRQKIIEHLAVTAQQSLLDPEPGKDIEPYVQTLRDVLSAYEGLVLATHSSSSEQYAFKDLGTDERLAYSRAKHAVTMLHQLHGPRWTGEKVAGDFPGDRP